MSGGALGAMCRYGIGLLLMNKYPHPPIPIAMLIVNVVGSLGLGLFLGHYFSSYEAFDLYNAPIFLLIGLGFFGAFTTFSTFSVETVLLLRNRQLKKAFLYVFLSIVLSIAFFSGAFLFITS